MVTLIYIYPWRGLINCIPLLFHKRNQQSDYWTYAKSCPKCGSICMNFRVKMSVSERPYFKYRSNNPYNSNIRWIPCYFPQVAHFFLLQYINITRSRTCISTVLFRLLSTMSHDKVRNMKKRYFRKLCTPTPRDLLFNLYGKQILLCNTCN